MKVRSTDATLFLIVAVFVGVVHLLMHLFGEHVPRILWLFPLALVIPVWPITALLDLALPLSVTSVIQSILSAVFWGLIAVGYRAMRRRFGPIFTGMV